MKYCYIFLFQHRIARMGSQLEAAKALTLVAASARDKGGIYVKVRFNAQLEICILAQY